MRLSAHLGLPRLRPRRFFKASKTRLRSLCILALFLLAASLALAFTLRSLATLVSLLSLRRNRPRHHLTPDVCHALGHDGASQTLLPNARFLCALAPVCFPSPALTASLITLTRPAPPACLHTSAQSRASTPVEPALCAAMRHHALACAHGAGWADAAGHPANNCSAAAKISAPDLARLTAAGKVHWHEGLTILVPQYAWVYNIYHHGRQLAGVAHVLRRLEEIVGAKRWAGLRAGGRVRVRVMFRMQGYYPSAWHAEASAMFFRSIFPEWAGREVEFVRKPSFLFGKAGKELVCLRSAVVLGAEGSTDAMMFLNDTDVASSVPDIPHEAIAFKGAAYRALGLAAEFAAVRQPPPADRRTPAAGGSERRGATETVEYSSVAVPPPVVAYAVRETNSSRRFLADDEAWFRSMLHKESSRRSLELRLISVPANQSLHFQVRNMRDVGFLVGLHGANLANAMFMPPTGALFEIFPYKYVKSFYRNGGNAGLRYSSHEASTGADVCSAHKSIFCASRYRDVVVNLTSADRGAIGRHVTNGMDYLVRLRRAFPSGRVPLARDKAAGPYRIQGFTAPASPIAVDQFQDTFRERDSVNRDGTRKGYVARGGGLGTAYRPLSES